MSKNTYVTIEEYTSIIEKEISHLEYLSNYLKEYNNVNGGLRAFFIFISFAAIPFVLPPLFCSLSSYDYNELVTFLGENIKYGHYETILESLFLFPIGGIMSLTDYFYNYKRSVKNENGIKEAREGLRRILIKNRETLAYLKEDNNDLLSQIQEIGKVYYDVGYHYKKYLKYYQKGILRRKVKKWYTEEQILEMEKYFEEKEITRKHVLGR